MAFSTQTGYRNPNGQEVLGPTGLPGTDHGQKVYVLRCVNCAHEYGANGTDIAGRRCPDCQSGRPGFEVSFADVIEAPASAKMSRNPPWTRDELILALDIYLDHPMAGEKSPVVQELSELLNRFWAATELDRKTLRNPAGVSMKFGNFQGLDPAYLASGRKGLPHGSRGDEEVWREFADDRVRLRGTAASIRMALNQTPSMVTSQDTGQEAEAAEGALLTRLHHYRERDASLARKRKAQALAAHGRLVCEACDFDFAQAYGERGDGFIEVHHTRPLETLQPGTRTKLSELAILCANCHRMVHARRPWLSMGELLALVAERRQTPDTQVSNFA